MIVETRYGKVQGACEYSCVVFKGIPYAMAPTGTRRFKRPEKIAKWDGIFDAAKWGKKCPQRAQEKGSFYQKEFYDSDEFSAESGDDCLNLNIWLPKNIEEKINEGVKLPVAIYVHGGAFMGGAGSNLPFVATNLVKEGVIIVTINYRLGVFGFLSHPILKEISGDTNCGNLGLWDQLAAIQWVYENIDCFGGDKDNITLFGQSAGAMSLQILALSDKLDGICKKMILESGGGYKNPLSSFKTQDEAEVYGNWLMEEICKDQNIDINDREGIKNFLINGDSSDVLRLSLEVVGRSFREGKGFAFLPVIDGEILKKDGNELIWEKEFLKIPYLLGANKDDITMEKATDFSATANPMEIANIEYAKLANESGADSFVYYFTRDLPGDSSRAFHSAELWYVFGSLEYSWRWESFSDHDRELSYEIIRYWTNFMKYGDPNYEGLPKWRKCTGDDLFLKIFE